MRGVVLAHVHSFRKGYGSGVSQPLYLKWRRMGVTHVQLNTFAYQPSLSSVRLFRRDPTLRRANVVREIRLAHRHGFRVLLKPHIWLGTASRGQWRNEIAYKDPKRRALWFRAYRDFLAEQLDIAAAEKVEMFAVGTELVMMARETEEWRRLIAFARTRYSGKLTYACEAWNARNIGFWNDLDAIGLDFYYGYEGSPADTTALARFYESKLREHLEHARTLGKPVILTEFGFPAHANAVRIPHSWPKAGVPRDDALQRQAYAAFAMALRRAPPHGVYVWKYVTTLDSYESEAYPRGFIVQGKPAEVEIARLFGGTAAAARPAPSRQVSEAGQTSSP